MEAHVSHQGAVEIKFDSQSEALLAPGGKKYLPCSACQGLEMVEMSVVTVVCEKCVTAQVKGGLTYCEECRHMVKPVEKDHRRSQCRYIPSTWGEDEEFETVMVGEMALVCPCCSDVLDVSFID